MMGRWLASAVAIVAAAGLAVSAQAVSAQAVSAQAGANAQTPAATAPGGLTPARLVDLRRTQLAGCGTKSFELAACRIALGEALLIERVYAEAVTVLTAANAGLAGDTSRPAIMLLARGQSALGEALSRSSRYGEAEAEIGKALAVLAAPADRARAQVRFARLLCFMGRIPQAGEVLVQARASAALAGADWDQDDAALLLVGSAFQANLDDRWADSERDATAAVTLIEAQHGPLDARLGDALSVLSGTVNMNSGPLAAEALNERRLRVEQSRERPNLMTLGSALNDLANNYDETNRPALSLPLRAQALAMTEAARPGQAASW